MSVDIHAYLRLDPDERTITCTECDEVICDADQNYKEHVAIRTGAVTDAGPVFAAPAEIYEEPPAMVFRQFFCPNCATLFDYEVVPEGDPILHDIELDVEALTDE